MQVEKIIKKTASKIFITSICSLYLYRTNDNIMPRPKRVRKMSNPPHFKGFKPIGEIEDHGVVVLHYEEYEAIRLSDYELKGQAESAIQMEISRPTFARIYESARRKVAQAFVEGKKIIFEGGKVFFNSEWYHCNACGCYFNDIEREKTINNCALCSSSEIKQYKEDQLNF